MPVAFPGGVPIRNAGPRPEYRGQGDVFGDVGEGLQAAGQGVQEYQALRAKEEKQRLMMEDMIRRRQLARRVQEAKMDMDVKEFEFSEEQEVSKQTEIERKKGIQETEIKRIDTERKASDVAWKGFKDDLREEAQPTTEGGKPKKPDVDKQAELARYNGVFETKEGRDRFKAATGATEAQMSAYQAGRLHEMAMSRGLRERKFVRQEGEQDIAKATRFVKNTKQAVELLNLFGKLDKAVPGGIYGSKGIAGFGFGAGAKLRRVWKTEQMKKIMPTLQHIVNALLKEKSGTAVTENELTRLEIQFGINTTGTVDEFRLGLQNAYEGIKQQYEDFSTADPGSAELLSKPKTVKDAPFGGKAAPAVEKTESDPLGLGF